MNKLYSVILIGVALNVLGGWTPALAYSTDCVSISRTLSYGSRGNDVSRLQQFLADQDFPGAGSWMITGYFGKATQVGVSDLQQLNDLPQTGIVDYATRNLITDLSCGHAPIADTYIPPYQPVALPTPCYYGGAYSTTCGVAHNPSSPTLFSISPTSGSIGSTVTVNGDGFTATGNTVTLGTISIPNVTSLDGRSLSFVVPRTDGYTYGQIALGTYSLSVTNGSGYTSNAMDFSITGYGAVVNPVISSVNGPSLLGINQAGTWTVTVSNPSSNYVRVSANWGDVSGYLQNNTPQTSYTIGTQTFTFTHSYVSTGNFSPIFTADNGMGSPSTSVANVTVSNSNGSAPSITAISPNVTRVNNSITLFGTNLSGSNTILINGTSAIYNAYSQSANSLSFVLPSTVSAYCASGQACPMYAQAITPGTYTLSVLNQNGSSNGIQLVVIQ